jgi:hypothetical protein
VMASTTTRFAAGLVVAIMGVMPLAAPSAAAPAAPVTPEAHGICVQATRQAELDHHLPPFLLAAISLAETGRWSTDHKASFSWPWTVMAEGIGRYLPTKAAAIAEVRRLQARGITNIDVGCLQINLFYHGDAFGSLEEALDPTANAQYAASFLAALNTESRSWTTAVASYHSRDTDRGAAYRDKVYDLWYGQRDHLIDSAKDTRLVNTAYARERDAARDAAIADRQNAADLNRVLAAARAANAAFLKTQAALTEARLTMQFESRKEAALAAFRERKRKREMARMGG